MNLKRHNSSEDEEMKSYEIQIVEHEEGVLERTKSVKLAPSKPFSEAPFKAFLMTKNDRYLK